MTNVMIEAENIRFAYGRHQVLRGVSLSAGSGECVAVLGPNGAGKSTFVTCLNGLRTPAPGSGKIRIAGKDVAALNRAEIARTIAYVAQDTPISRMTVYDWVMLGRKPYIRWAVSEKDTQLCLDMIDRVGMTPMRLRRLAELSGGERQKVLLARALVQEPKVLILDEPTSNLDPKNQYEMMGLVRRLAQERGFTAVVVLHDLNLALRYCNRFLFLREGREFAYVDAAGVTGEIISTVYDVQARILFDDAVTPAGGEPRRLVSIDEVTQP
ncbi:ABC transporter ATP-binding protein [Actinobaculum suis]|uniref:ABC transporter ATP-binding protein n=1 Tax=Actinobaculum suis TaxID=1657 RepID=UPI00080A5B44|nr:ABC transporter ATP-binding protein [Actinobaculum suis]OCA93607.1 hypothetical protein ACU20_08660 [Actinobaculum suis]